MVLNFELYSKIFLGEAEGSGTPLIDTLIQMCQQLKDHPALTKHDGALKSGFGYTIAKREVFGWIWRVVEYFVKQDDYRFALKYVVFLRV